MADAVVYSSQFWPVFVENPVPTARTVWRVSATVICWDVGTDAPARTPRKQRRSRNPFADPATTAAK
jgi:hypothetical protein